ncbi:EAL domain-containing protein [Pectobacterium carotovorum]|uniref:cyclic-guanylate-specific phosphodiesterase n=1 Tax=Pectobacterium carotovorum subsp. carotovorum TaxID=555 RepID=A0AAI9KZ20_PECCC|nr:EAL domain-containing protein [Pectobacterium carotovorum]KHT32409.1 diguanylate phosphodiesterase [Pectobacterium carotovorum subsp. carotovorum]ULS50292.1 EAL domain-containing protein [Pectobacterium carotovorum]GKX46491.1 cyclic diguanylate phosphodiesterase [Pectobacterium carotovorum subsp. carotovorum]GLV68737.1 cyclic diguanylate phosphodiesterase [Pectobacterium carotovorum subsp. carotovorum]
MKKSLLAYFQTLYFKKSFFLLSSSLFFTLVALFALVLAVYSTFSLRQFEGEVDDFSDVTVEHAGKIIQQATSALDILEQKFPPYCDNPHLDLLRKIAYDNDYIQDVVYIDGNRPRCSSMLSEINTMFLPEPDFHYKDVYDIWYKIESPLNKNKPMIYVGATRHLVVLNPRSFLDVPSYSYNIQYALLEKNKQDGRVILSDLMSGNIYSRLTAGGNNPDRFYIDDKYYVLKPLPDSDLALVVRADKPASFSFYLTIFFSALPIFMLISLMLSEIISRKSLTIQSPRYVLNQALRQKEFELHYQPIIKLDTAQVVGCEALIRWRHSDGHLITPDSFIPMIRQVGLMKALTLFIINEALQTASVLKKSYPDMFVSINLEAAEFEDMSVFNYLVEQVAVYELKGANVNVELTESSMIEPQKAAPMVELYQQQGIDVAIDDFGTGYSGLSYLERVKANKLKIDKSFVGNISDHSPTDIVLSHIVSMAHCLNLHIVAEGIEAPAQEAYLKSLGVAYAQGWLYSKALTQEALITFLAEKGETASDES